MLAGYVERSFKNQPEKTKVFIDIFYYRAALSGLKTYINELLCAVKEHGSDEIEYVISHDISKMANKQFFINSKFRLVRWVFQFRYLAEAINSSGYII